MNIELLFLKKAISDKNYISFTFQNKKYEKIKPIALENKILKTSSGEFDFKEIKKLIVLKDKF